MEKTKSKKYLTIALSVVYIFSIIYFFINKEFGKSGTSISGLLGTIVLYILSKKYDGLIYNRLYNVLVIFILSSTLLGSSYRLYDKINYYDDFLHFWSGFINVSVAFSILNYFNKEEVVSKMSKFFIIIYLFAFSMGISNLCEITEFLLDTFGGLNTQSGGLTDTIVDMIDSLFGSIIMVSIIIRKIKKTKK